MISNDDSNDNDDDDDDEDTLISDKPGNDLQEITNFIISRVTEVL